MITVKYFASLRNIAGKDEEAYDLGNETNLQKLTEAISTKTSSQIGEMIREGKVLVSVNQDVVSAEAIICDGDEVAFLPPFSGGSGIRITV